MRRSVIETVLGAIVLLLAVAFLIFSYKTADVRRVSGYDVTAAFTGTGGLAEGDDVRISGVKIGSVNKLALDPDKYLAIVTMSINPTTKLPDDTSAIISSDSLLGGRYLELQPGGSDKMLKNGDRIQYTQAPQNLEQLLGKFIFSMSSSKDKNGQDSGSAAPAAGSSGATPPTLGASAAANSVTIPPAPPLAASPKPVAPAKLPETSGVKPSSEPATPPPPPPAPSVDTGDAQPDAGPTALKPETPPPAITPPGLPGSESAMPDSTMAQPVFQSAAPAVTPSPAPATP